MSAPQDQAQLRSKLLNLKVDELKDVLALLGLNRQGRKADLQQRLLGALGDGVAGVGWTPNAPYGAGDPTRIAAAFRRVEELSAAKRPNYWLTQQTAAAAAAGFRTPAAGGGDVKNILDAAALTAAAAAVAASRKRPRPEDANGLGGSSSWGGGGRGGSSVLNLLGASNTKIRCVCRDVHETPHMAQCSAPGCGVWQHLTCMPRPAPDPQQPQAAPPPYFCERCRLARADPFWELYDGTVLLPARLTVAGAAVEGRYPQTTGLLALTLTQQQMLLLQTRKEEFRLQAACLLPSDPVPFRIHWPAHSELHVNSHWVRSSPRVGDYKMGINARDDPADLLPYVHAGRSNTVQLTCRDMYTGYVLLVCIVRRRTMQQVKVLMAPEDPLEAALARAVRVLRGNKPPPGPGAAPDSDDEDITVVNNVVSLMDPNSLQRIVTPARFVDTNQGLACFDLDNFLNLAQRTLKWLDPHNSQPSSVQMLQVDAYIAAILQCLAARPEVREVEVTPEGLWRPAGSGEPYRSVLNPAHMAEAAAAGAGRGAGASNGTLVALSDSESEEDAEEELRQAAAAVRAQSAARPPAAAKPAVEVIDLLSDSDEEEGGAGAAAPPAAAAGASAGAGSSNGASQPQPQQQPQQPPIDGSRGAGAAGGAGHSNGAAQGGQAGPSGQRGSTITGDPNSGKFKIQLRRPGQQQAAGSTQQQQQQQQPQQQRPAVPQQVQVSQGGPSGSTAQHHQHQQQQPVPHQVHSQQQQQQQQQQQLQQLQRQRSTGPVITTELQGTGAPPLPHTSSSGGAGSGLGAGSVARVGSPQWGAAAGGSGALSSPAIPGLPNLNLAPLNIQRTVSAMAPGTAAGSPLYGPAAGAMRVGGGHGVGPSRMMSMPAVGAPFSPSAAAAAAGSNVMSPLSRQQHQQPVVQPAAAALQQHLQHLQQPLLQNLSLHGSLVIGQQQQQQQHQQHQQQQQQHQQQHQQQAAGAMVPLGAGVTYMGNSGAGALNQQHQQQPAPTRVLQDLAARGVAGGSNASAAAGAAWHLAQQQQHQQQQHQQHQQLQHQQQQQYYQQQRRVSSGGGGSSGGGSSAPAGMPGVPLVSAPSGGSGVSTAAGGSGSGGGGLAGGGGSGSWAWPAGAGAAMPAAGVASNHHQQQQQQQVQQHQGSTAQQLYQQQQQQVLQQQGSGTADQQYRRWVAASFLPGGGELHGANSGV